MTISPVAAPVAAPASAGPATPGAGADFASLVEEHLARDSAPGAPSSGAAGESTAAMPEDGTAPSAVPPDALATLLAGLVTAPAPVAAHATGRPDPAADADATSATTDAASGLVATLAAAVSATTAPAAGTSAVAAPQDGIPAAPATAAGPGTVSTVSTGPVLVTTLTGEDAADPGKTRAVDTTGKGAGKPAEGPGAAPTAASAAPEQAGPVSSGALTPVAVTAQVSTSGAGPQASPQALRGNAVTEQVFGQVTRLVGRGEGTHRLTLRLHPADLGEVKVVLTVRNGNVDVTLSAGAQAREALRDGSPHLRSLLELTGAGAGHVTLRDLATGATTFTSSASTSQHLAGGDPNDQHAGTGRGGEPLADTHAETGSGHAGGQNGGQDSGRPRLTGDVRLGTRPAGRPGGPTSTTSTLDLNL